MACSVMTEYSPGVVLSVRIFLLVAECSIAVFDLGGVLIDWNPRYLYRSMFDNDEDMETFLGSVCTMEWHYQHDLGRPMTETLPELVAQYPQYEAHIRSWVREAEMIAGAIEPTV